jgi:hypothetical protein
MSTLRTGFVEELARDDFWLKMLTDVGDAARDIQIRTMEARLRIPDLWFEKELKSKHDML